ncbi:uncharacterized protein LOC116351977 [Contarinia nasturtii]|uniref:uncharacterized protein LOC116351977 n=1 Tax=Contarinia nasturtii TaxID=265458 RepID=UPI0012D3F427|nr:uncharacterized protein LOC116351977 [Contarinia nasturtii]
MKLFVIALIFLGSAALATAAGTKEEQQALVDALHNLDSDYFEKRDISGVRKDIRDIIKFIKKVYPNVVASGGPDGVLYREAVFASIATIAVLPPPERIRNLLNCAGQAIPITFSFPTGQCQFKTAGN